MDHYRSSVEFVNTSVAEAAQLVGEVLILSLQQLQKKHFLHVILHLWKALN